MHLPTSLSQRRLHYSSQSGFGQICSLGKSFGRRLTRRSGPETTEALREVGGALCPSPEPYMVSLVFLGRSVWASQNNFRLYIILQIWNGRSHKRGWSYRIKKKTSLITCIINLFKFFTLMESVKQTTLRFTVRKRPQQLHLIPSRATFDTQHPSLILHLSDQFCFNKRCEMATKKRGGQFK